MCDQLCLRNNKKTTDDGHRHPDVVVLFLSGVSSEAASFGLLVPLEVDGAAHRCNGRKPMVTSKYEAVHWKTENKRDSWDGGDR